MQKATIRVCKNCTYFKRISSQSIPLCIHKISCKTDLVTGECTYLTARDMRADNTLCGKEGVLYEQIKNNLFAYIQQMPPPPPWTYIFTLWMVFVSFT